VVDSPCHPPGNCELKHRRDRAQGSNKNGGENKNGAMCGWRLQRNRGMKLLYSEKTVSAHRRRKNMMTGHHEEYDDARASLRE